MKAILRNQEGIEKGSGPIEEPVETLGFVWGHWAGVPLLLAVFAREDGQIDYAPARWVKLDRSST